MRIFISDINIFILVANGTPRSSSPTGLEGSKHQKY